MPTVTNMARQRPVWGTLVPLDERCEFHRAVGRLIETDLHQPYLDGVTAHIDRG